MKIFVKRQKGFTLLTAIVVTSILLLVSFVVADVALKELILAYSGQESQYAFYNAESGIECAEYWDIYGIGGSSVFSTTTSQTIHCNNASINNSEALDIIPSGQHAVVGGSVAGGAQTVWMNDSVPSGAVQASDESTPWNWVSSNPSPYNGSVSVQSGISAGEHQNYFYNASPTFQINAGDSLFAYVYPDPANPPSEIMLQWNDGSWEHRAYWGSNFLPWGVDGTISRHYMGPIPTLGQWDLLQVPASTVGVEGSSLNGMAFSLNGGRASWDYAGKVAAGSSVTNIFEVGYSHGCAIVQVIKSGTGTEIDSRGYNTCNTASDRRYERGIKVTY